MSNNAKALFEIGREILREGGVDSPAFDASLLFERFCGLSRADIPLAPEFTDTGFISACKRRADGEPLQYILGVWEFMGLDFYVGTGVLIPRADTETLVEYIRAVSRPDARILDMCTGSGCIGISLKHFLPEASVTLCDISEKALAYARRNAAANGTKVRVKKADLTNGCSAYFKKGAFDIIVANPPYIKTRDMSGLSRELAYEPVTALCGGEDGTDFYRALILDWRDALSEKGEMVLEAGYDTANDIRALFTECGYRDIQTRRDISGTVRLVSARKPK